MASVSVSVAGPSAPAVAAAPHGVVDPPAPNHHGVSHGARANIWSSTGVRTHSSPGHYIVHVQSHMIFYAITYLHLYSTPSHIVMMKTIGQTLDWYVHTIIMLSK